MLRVILPLKQEVTEGQASRPDVDDLVRLEA